ncbi:hypothetical protein [Aquabacterium sp. A08]|uniref:hypothetical protein n=1 Tax=Aquabacterium sp. A08 TaxID=2718532 RepID=UPI0014229CFD|nr:hypothetical protein [Aquabacterium sp. A08]NIC41502.1 hypothetical protein [Aquabacterium sp. A08]
MKKRDHLHKQRGVATLLTTVVFLAVMSIMAVYANRSAITENAMMSNAYRAKQAAEVADGALDYALASFFAGGADSQVQNQLDTFTAAELSAALGGRRATVSYCDPSSTPANCIAPAGGNLTNLMVVATGWSDDGTAVHRVSTLVTENPFFSAAPKAPLILKGAGSSFLSGNLSLTNNTATGINVWTGSDIGSASGSFETFGRVNNVDSQRISEKVQNRYYLGPDIIYNDQNLKNANNDEFYTGVLGRSASQLAGAADFKFSSAAGLQNSNNYAGKIIYIDGDYTLDRDLGTANASTILIVKGKFETSGNHNVYGSVVAGSLGRTVGTPTIYGSLIALDATSLQGNVKVIMTQQSINNMQQLTVKSTVGNSWRDWD